MARFWAHSDGLGRQPETPGARWQLLRDHLRAVGEMAESFAIEAGGSRAFGRRARVSGLLHDLGKYRDEFQQLLRGEVTKAPHSIYGACAARLLGKAPDLSFVVAGHHAGMPDKAALQDRTGQARNSLEALWERAVSDCPELAECFADGAGNPGLLERPEWIETRRRVLVVGDFLHGEAEFGDNLFEGSPLVVLEPLTGGFNVAAFFLANGLVVDLGDCRSAIEGIAFAVE